MKAIINVDIYDYWGFITNAYVIFDTKILEVGQMGDFHKIDRQLDDILDGKGALLMPGHIISHQHIYSAYARGAVVEPYAPRTFTERLRQLWWKLDKVYDLEATYTSSKVYGIEFIKSGVTTVFDHHASGWIRGSLEQIKRGLTDEMGIRSVLCFETSDRFNIDECIKENITFANENKSETCRGMFGMHASLTLGQDTLKRIADARGEIPIHTHAAESIEEEMESLNLYSMRSIERFDHFGLLDHCSLLAHCTNINELEAEIMAKHDCVAAINPTANLNSNNGLPDCDLLNRFGIRTTIGTDALGTNIAKEYQHTFFYMQSRLNDRTGKKFTKNDLLGYIRNIYEYTSYMLNIKLGKIKPGYEADLILVPYQVTTKITPENVFSYILSGVYTHFFPRDVLIAGDFKMRNFLTIFDEEKIFEHSRNSAQRVWNNIGVRI